MGSPFFGVGYFSAVIGEPGTNAYESAVASAMFWSVFYATVAGGLLTATLLSFDRCLGRVPDGPALPGLMPRRQDAIDADPGAGRGALTQPAIVVDVFPNTLE